MSRSDSKTAAQPALVVLPLAEPDRPWSLNVIVVPDFTKDGTVQDDTDRWLSSMLSSERTQARVFRYHYSVASKSSRPIWHQLRDRGVDILRLFEGHFANSLTILEKPLVWIGYGLGGFVVKSAVHTVSIEASLMFQRIAGVVLFGTPHVRSENKEHWGRLNHLVRFAGKWPKSFIAQSDKTIKAALDLCQGFEQCGLEASILSVYETRYTKVKLDRWFHKSLIPLVDARFSETWVKNETPLPNDVPHDSVGSFSSDSEIHRKVSAVLQKAIELAPLGAALDTAETQPRLWESSTVNDQPYDSNRANMGSSMQTDYDLVPSIRMNDYVGETLKSEQWPSLMMAGLKKNRNFVGRDDVFREIDQVFFKQSSASIASAPFITSQLEEVSEQIPCCCINGLGGIGKTQTAIEYALSRQNLFDAIFVIRADSNVKLFDSFTKIVEVLDPTHSANEADDIVERDNVMKWLSSPTFSNSALAARAEALGKESARELKWLLIFDNIEPSADLRDFWPPVINMGCILITTRDGRNISFLSSQTQVQWIELDGLEPIHASKLLVKLGEANGHPPSQQDISDVVAKLQGFPLAMEYVMAYIIRKDMSLKEFAAYYDDTIRESHRPRSGNDPAPSTSVPSWGHMISSRWALDSLKEEEKALLRIYAFLDPDSIQDLLLTEYLNLKENGQEPPRFYPWDALTHIDIRAALLRNSLISVSTDAGNVIVKMHRVTQAISLAGLTQRQVVEHFEFITSLLFTAWPFTEHSWDHQAGGWDTQQVLLQHTIRLSQVARKHDLAGISVSSLRNFITLLSSGGWYRQERGDFDSGISLFELGVNLCELSAAVSQYPSDLRADLEFGLGGAYCDTNRWPLFLHHAKLQLKYRLLSEPNSDESPTSLAAIAYSELGAAQALMKQYEEAIVYCDKSLTMYSKQPEVIDGSFFPAFPHIHRALALVGAGRPKEAEEGLMGIISWHYRRHGPKHTEFKLGYAWHCCGLVYGRQGKLIDSVNAYGRARENYLPTVGHLYHRTGNVCGKLAEYHANLGDHVTADQYFLEAERAYESQPHYKPELARHYFIQSQALRARGDNQSSETQFQKSRKLHAEIALRDAGDGPTVVSLERHNDRVAPWVW